MNKNQKKISLTKNTPAVIIDHSGMIKFTGRLISENPEDLFIQIGEWVKEYFNDPAEITCIEICLEYINSVGTKYLLDIIHEITQIYLKNNDKKFVINWYYKEEDEDMLEKGTFFSSVLKIPVNFLKIS